MKRTRRQGLALLALIVAGLASLATSQASPSIYQETKDHLSFAGPQRTEVRHVRIEVVAGNAGSTVSADVQIETGGVNGKRPVTLTVTRDRDGASVLDDYGPDYQTEAVSNLAGSFLAIDACPKAQTCVETFTFTFTRIPEDARQSLAFDWSIQGRSTYSVVNVASPPPGASLSVTITR